MHRMTIHYREPADVEAFDQHYTDVHVPLATRLPGLRRLIMTHPRSIGGAPAVHLVAELWFDDRENLRTALSSPEMAACGADVETFDVAAVEMYSGEVDEINF